MAINVFCTAPVGRFLDNLKIPSNINLKIAEYAVDEDLKNGLRWCDRHISNARIVIHDDLLADCQNLEFIYQPSIGHDNLRLNSPLKKIVISGLWEENEFRKNRITTAEHTLSLILSHMKSLEILFSDVREFGRWDNRRYNITDLSDSTVGIIGLGNVGRALAKLVLAFGSRVFAFDPYISNQEIESSGVTRSSFEQILQTCDVVSFHTPLNKSTTGMFDIECVNSCACRPLIVNCARGGVVDEEAILKGLEANLLRGYACDVLENEKPDGVEDNQLVSMMKNDRRLLISPHVGGSSFNYMRDIFQIALERVAFE